MKIKYIKSIYLSILKYEIRAILDIKSFSIVKLLDIYIM